MKNKNILIVEDEVLIANYIKRCIERQGYHCAGIAISYNQAITFLQETSVDTVLVDVNLFGNRSGVELGSLLSGFYKIPFFYLTSHTDAETVTEIKKTLPNGYFVKPINEVALNTTLDLLFAGSIHPAKELFSFQIGSITYRIALDELHFVRSDGNYLELHLTTEKKLIRSTIKDFTDMVPDGTLVKINRREAINPKHMVEIQGSAVTMASGNIFKISPLLKEQFLANKQS